MYTEWNRQSLKPVNETDPKGKNTWEWKFRDGRQITVYRRPRGFVTCHVHSGSDPSKNPERMLLLYGKAQITFYRPGREDNSMESIICSAIKNPEVITITTRNFPSL